MQASSFGLMCHLDPGIAVMLVCCMPNHAQALPAMDMQAFTHIETSSQWLVSPASVNAARYVEHPLENVMLSLKHLFGQLAKSLRLMPNLMLSARLRDGMFLCV